MDYFCILLVSIISQLGFQCEASISLGERGVRPVNSGDTAMVFYVNINHTGKAVDAPIAARLKMEKCCLIDAGNVTICDAMKLVSGLGVVLQPNEKFTLQMYFVNFDLQSREGTCILKLLTKHLTNNMTSPSIPGDHQQWDQGESIEIHFKTGSSVSNIFQKLLTSTGFAQKGYTNCNSENENDAQECGNLYCQIRYVGSRSFQSMSNGVCNPTPDCDANGKLVLSPITGTCEVLHAVAHIQSSFTPEMLMAMGKLTIHHEHSSDLKAKQSDPSFLTNQKSHKPDVICEHGERVLGPGGRPNCTCHEGWKSVTTAEWELKEEPLISDEGTPLYKMCTVPNLDQEEMGLILLGFLVIAIIITIAGFATCLCRKNVKSRTPSALAIKSSKEGIEGGDDDSDKTPEHQKANEDDDDALISEITSRREPTPKRHWSNETNTGSSDAQTDVKEYKSLEKTQQPSTSPSTSTVAKSKSKLSTLSFAFKPREKPSSDDISIKKLQPKASIISLIPSNNNPFFKRASKSPSTDDMLTMDKVEKSGAHIPITPSVSKESILSAKKKACDNRNQTFPIEIKPTAILTSPSEKEVTVKKQSDWKEYYYPADLRESQTSLKPAPCSISVSTEVGTEINSNVVRLSHSFNEAVKSQKTPHMNIGAATKVYSLPEINYHLPQAISPDLLVQKEPSESNQYRSRQSSEHNLLSSLTNPRFASTSSSELSNINHLNNHNVKVAQSSHSIWSNVASENATEPEPDLASRTSSYGDVRMKRIYGTVESDEDSDAALEEIACSAQERKPTISELFEQNKKLYGFPQNSSTVSSSMHSGIEMSDSEIQGTFQHPVKTHPVDSSCLRMESDVVPSEAYITRNSSTLPSPTQSMSEFFSLAEISNAASASQPLRGNHSLAWPHRFSNIANQINSSCGGYKDETSTKNASLGASEYISATDLISSETTSAYNIRTSLKQSLTASRSRSDSNNSIMFVNTSSKQYL